MHRPINPLERHTLSKKITRRYRRPQADGTYAESRIVRSGETLEIAALPDASFTCDQLLPKRAG